MGTSSSTLIASSSSVDKIVGLKKANVDHDLLYPRSTIVDGGYMYPSGIYNSSPSAGTVKPIHRQTSDEQLDDCLKYDLNLVQQLIMNRHLAPFYKGLAEFADVEHVHSRILGVSTRPASSTSDSRRKLADNIFDSISATDKSCSKTSRAYSQHKPKRNRGMSAVAKSISGLLSPSSSSSGAARNRQQSVSAPNSPEEGPLSRCSSSNNLYAEIYKDPVECPICFLIYPSNINYTSCCNQSICTECFVEIHRGIDLSPACCPFCCQEQFGVYYRQFEFDSDSNDIENAFTNQDVHNTVTSQSLQIKSPHLEVTSMNPEPAPSLRRPKSQFAISTSIHASKRIVTTDEIRPKLLEYIQAKRKAAQEAARLAEIEQQIQLARLLQGPSNWRRRQNPSHSRPRQSALPDLPFYVYESSGSSQDMEDLMINEAIRRSLNINSPRNSNQDEQQQQTDARYPLSDTDDEVPLSQLLSEMAVNGDEQEQS